MEGVDREVYWKEGGREMCTRRGRGEGEGFSWRGWTGEENVKGKLRGWEGE